METVTIRYRLATTHLQYHLYSSTAAFDLLPIRATQDAILRRFQSKAHEMVGTVCGDYVQLGRQYAVISDEDGYLERLDPGLAAVLDRLLIRSFGVTRECLRLL